jgi:hypothetical protein
VSDLETLQAVTALSLAANHVNDLVDQLGTLSVVTLSPVVTGTSLTEHKVVRAEEAAERTSADGIHGTGLEIDEDSARNIFSLVDLVTFAILAS